MDDIDLDNYGRRLNRLREWDNDDEDREEETSFNNGWRDESLLEFNRDHPGVFSRSSESLLKRIRLTQNQKGEVNGAEFDGVKIIVREKDGLRYSNNKNFKSKIDEFKSLVEKVKEERRGTAVGFAEESVPDVTIDDNHAESIVNDSIERLEEEISNRGDEIIPLLTENEIREFGGLNFRPERFNLGQ